MFTNKFSRSERSVCFDSGYPNWFQTEDDIHYSSTFERIFLPTRGAKLRIPNGRNVSLFPIFNGIVGWTDFDDSVSTPSFQFTPRRNLCAKAFSGTWNVTEHGKVDVATDSSGPFTVCNCTGLGINVCEKEKTFFCHYSIH